MSNETKSKTPKDASYKLRQAEFRKLNKRRLKPDAHGNVILEEIKYKEIINSN